jgi:hypothetical protein
VEDPTSYYGEQTICLALEVLRQHPPNLLVEVRSREGKALGSEEGKLLGSGLCCHQRTEF